MSLKKFVQARARNDRGAVAVLVAMVAIVLFGMAAMAVDITQQVNQRQELHDTIDEGAHAGAFDLPNTTAAAKAIAFAKAIDPDSNPTAEMYCVVASLPQGASYIVDAAQIPTACNPGVPPFNVTKYPGLRCNSKICAIPCYPATGGQCNTLRLIGQKPVPFGFARALGINQGSTGTVSSAACRGPCGGPVTVPLDLVVVGDRTGSMGVSGREALRDAIKGMLGTLDPTKQRVALGTIGESASPAPGNGNVAPANCLSLPATNKASGLWVPVGFTDNYLTGGVGSAVNTTSSPLGMAVKCLGDSNSSTGTYLAAPFRTARDVIKGTCQPSYCDVNGLAPRPAPTKKAIIFMTDGEPNEQSPPGNGLPWSSNGDVACNNVLQEATAAKNEGTVVATIAFRLEGVKCAGNSSSKPVTEVLAAMASDAPASAKFPGPSLDDGGDGPGGLPGGCKANQTNGPEGILGENTDGDYFFCTPTPSQLTSLFQSAVAQISGNIRFIRMP